jgi:hypothetical protein
MALGTQKEKPNIKRLFATRDNAQKKNPLDTKVN